MTDDTLTTDIAFTPSVKAVQDALGSRAMMDRLSRTRGFQTEITEDFAAFLARQVSFFLASASADGRPYVQHRGGPPGFVEVREPQEIAFADYRGNKQYITLGNLAENDRVMLFFLEYETKTRIKLWGRARAEDLTGPDRHIAVAVEAWDINCQQHLPDLFGPEAIRQAQSQLIARVTALEEENARLKAALARAGGEATGAP
jgi:predicted pyridoxine 5'-phosphate oxidase superfamily flavin-nucleotide-binding protein